MVTVSPDVGTSTNLGGWINKAGIWIVGDRIDWFADDTDTLVRWRESDHGQHIELGIAEVNLVGLLGELGATWSRDGQPLLPVGTIYDPFVARALEPWSFGIYAGGQSILVGTPSGVTLGPEGGAHQSVRHAVDRDRAAGLRRVGARLRARLRVDVPARAVAARAARTAARPTSGCEHAADRPGAGRLAEREHVLAGGYRLREGSRLTIAVMGALVPEALEAADELDAEVVCVTSADLLFRAFQARAGLGERRRPWILEELFPEPLPIVSLLDGHPHTLSFLAAVHGVPMTCLGVQRFGQSGDIAELYEHHEIDAESVVGAALDLIG